MIKKTNGAEEKKEDASGCYYDIKKLLENVYKWTIDGKEVSEKELFEYIEKQYKERNEENENSK